MLIADIATHYPILLLSGVVASSFYGSILSYTMASHRAHQTSPTRMWQGAVLGPMCVVGGLCCIGGAVTISIDTSTASLLDSTIGAYSWGLHCGFGMCHFWMVLIWGSWIGRDRHRPGVYGTLGHAYFEAVTDGVMALSCPVTAGMAAVVGMAIQTAVRYIL